MTNLELYELTIKFCDCFNCVEQKNFPAKISFYIQKNRKILVDAYNEIEQIRRDTLEKYGNFDQYTQSYSFEPKIIDKVNKELEEFGLLEQELPFFKINISDLEGLEFTLEQMDALMFMIEE